MTTVMRSFILKDKNNHKKLTNEYEMHRLSLTLLFPILDSHGCRI